MGYAAKSGMKFERQKGIEAAENLEAYGIDKTMALAYAKLNKKLYEQVDVYDNARFCETMEQWRENQPEAYASFWWWRMAHEQKAKPGEEDTQEEPSFRQFMITQFLAAPFDWDAWEDDRIHLKPGVEPWITEEQIKQGLDHRTIKRWVYGMHWRDIYTEEDEITDRNMLRKAGERKFAHFHIVGDTAPARVTVSQLCRWFNVPPTQVKILRGHGAFLDAAEYLPHESPKAVAEGKTHYDYDEFCCSSGFDLERELQTLQSNRARYGKRAGAMSAEDTMRMHVLEDGWSMRDCRKDDPITYAKIRSTLPGLRLDYLMDAPPVPLRINIYVDGSSGMGKTTLCRYLAENLFPGVDSASFEIGNDKRVTFDGYDGEPCIIWNELRADEFVRRFGLASTLNIIETHPSKEAQQAKHSRVILCNSVNIINGIQPYEKFLEGLIDAATKEGSKDEDPTQVYRRMPMIICVRESDFEVMLNKGFVNHELYAYKQYISYAHITGSMKRVMENLDEVAKTHVLKELGTPVVEGVAYLQEHHDDKITKVEDLPEEFKNYGKVVYGPIAGDKYDEDAWEQLQQEKAIEAQVQPYIEWHELDEIAKVMTEYAKSRGVFDRGKHTTYTFAEWQMMDDNERKMERERIRRICGELGIQLSEK